MNLEQHKNLDDLMEKLGEDVTTAFLVYQTQDGNWTAVADFKNKNLNLDREATSDDIIAGSAAVHSGATSQQTAFFTVMMMEQRAAAAQKYMQEQAAAQQAAKLIDPTKIRNPRA